MKRLEVHMNMPHTYIDMPHTYINICDSIYEQIHNTNNVTHNTNKTIILLIIYRQQTVAGVTDLHLEQIALKVLIRSG